MNSLENPEPQVSSYHIAQRDLFFHLIFQKIVDGFILFCLFSDMTSKLRIVLIDPMTASTLEASNTDVALYNSRNTGIIL
jgi:hypothetical protein